MEAVTRLTKLEEARPSPRVLGTLPQNLSLKGPLNTIFTELPACSQTMNLLIFWIFNLADLGKCQTLVPALAAAEGSKSLRKVAYLLEQGAVISGNVVVLALGETDDAIAMFQTFLDHGWTINSKTDLGNINRFLVSLLHKRFYSLFFEDAVSYLSLSCGGVCDGWLSDAMRRNDSVVRVALGK